MRIRAIIPDENRQAGAYPDLLFRNLADSVPGVSFTKVPGGGADRTLLLGPVAITADRPFLFLWNVDDVRWPERGPWPFRRPRKHGYDQLLSQVAGVFVPHDALAIALREELGYRGQVHSVGHGLPQPWGRLVQLDEVTRRINREVYGREGSFFLARSTGHPSDNLPRLIEAYDRFRKRCSEPVRLLILGDVNGQPRSVRKAIKKATHRAAIQWLTLAWAHEEWKLISSARAVLYPSLSTRFPTEILIAWHAGVPVLADHPDVLAGAGAQVRGEDVNSIAEGLVALVTTPFLASGLVENGRRRLEEFTWERVARRVAEVITAPSVPPSS